MLGLPIESFEDEEVKSKYLSKDWNSITIRKFLQLLGTEAIRNGVHSNAWVNALFADYKPIRTKINSDDTEEYIDTLPNWIITDVRFPNEAKSIKDRGGLLIRVFRPGKLRVWWNDPAEDYEEENSSGYYYVQAIEGKIWSISEYADGLGSQAEVYSHELKLDPTDNHPSETALDNYDFDEVILNDGDIESLIRKVKEILLKYKII